MNRRNLPAVSEMESIVAKSFVVLMYLVFVLGGGWLIGSIFMLFFALVYLAVMEIADLIYQFIRNILPTSESEVSEDTNIKS